MTTLLYVAAALTLVTGVLHSYLGERYILMRMFSHGNLNDIYRNPTFKSRTLRFAWHLTTIAWWGFAAILVALARGETSPATVGTIIAGTFLIHSAITAWASRGRHLAWPVFLAIGVLSFLATR